jgi:hypothetical protein
MLQRLGTPAPTLTWNLYRNVFAHNDEFQLGRVVSRRVPTGIIISNADRPRGTLLDIGALYRSLVAYLDERIEQTPPQAKVDYISGIWFLRDGPRTKQLQAELDALAHEP